jgi:hypothetical protein
VSARETGEQEDLSREKVSYRGERTDIRHREGSRVGYSRQEIYQIRTQMINRPQAVRLIQRDHRGDEDHRVSDEIILQTLNEPQVILLSRNGNWVFYRTGTIVVTRPGVIVTPRGGGAPYTRVHTAFGAGGRVPQRRLAMLRALYDNPNLKIDDEEKPVDLDRFIELAGGAFSVFKIWP